MSLAVKVATEILATVAEFVAGAAAAEDATAVAVRVLATAVEFVTALAEVVAAAAEALAATARSLHARRSDLATADTGTRCRDTPGTLAGSRGRGYLFLLLFLVIAGSTTLNVIVPHCKLPRRHRIHP